MEAVTAAERAAAAQVHNENKNKVRSGGWLVDSLVYPLPPIYLRK